MVVVFVVFFVCVLCCVVLCFVLFVARPLVFGKSVGPARISKVSILERRNSKK